MPRQAPKTGVFEALTDLVRAQPFVPFDMKTADGDAIHVLHPDFIARSPTSSTAIVYERDGHFQIVHLNMVVAIEPTKPRKGMLGSPGKR